MEEIPELAMFDDTVTRVTLYIIIPCLSRKNPSLIPMKPYKEPRFQMVYIFPYGFQNIYKTLFVYMSIDSDGYIIAV